MRRCFFNDTATTEIYTLSLHDALPICGLGIHRHEGFWMGMDTFRDWKELNSLWDAGRSEEHTSELQSLAYLVCRLLLEKKKNITLQKTAKEVRQTLFRLSAQYANIRVW